MAAPRRKAAARNNEVTQTEVPCSHKRKAAAKTVETHNEAPHRYVRKAVAKKNEDTQTEIPKQDTGVQLVSARAWRYRPLQCLVREAAIVYDVTR